MQRLRAPPGADAASKGWRRGQRWQGGLPAADRAGHRKSNSERETPLGVEGSGEGSGGAFVREKRVRLRAPCKKPLLST